MGRFQGFSRRGRIAGSARTAAHSGGWMEGKISGGKMGKWICNIVVMLFPEYNPAGNNRLIASANHVLQVVSGPNHNILQG